MSILAEISDKIATLPEVFLYSTLAACVLGGVARLHRWLLVLPLGTLAFLNYVSIGELREPGWCRAIVDEMGYGWVVGTFFNMNLPFIVVLVFLVRAYRADARVRRERKYAAGLCGYCGYDLTGNVSGVCPECGQAVPLVRLAAVGAHEQGKA